MFRSRSLYSAARRTRLTCARNWRHGVSKKTEPKPIETPFGDLPGKSAEDVAKLIIEIFRLLRYVDIDGTFASLSTLYEDEDSASLRAAIVEATEELAQHNLNIWKEAGPAVQMQLSTVIAHLSGEERLANRSILIAAWHEFLKTELQGSTWTADAVTLSTGALPWSEELAKIRSQAIDGLFDLFDRSGSEDEQREVIQALWGATHLADASAVQQRTVRTGDKRHYTRRRFRFEPDRHAIATITEEP